MDIRDELPGMIAKGYEADDHGDDRLEGAKVRMRTLRHFTVTLGTDGPTLTLAVHPDRVEVEKVAVGN